MKINNEEVLARFQNKNGKYALTTKKLLNFPMLGYNYRFVTRASVAKVFTSKKNMAITRGGDLGHPAIPVWCGYLWENKGLKIGCQAFTKLQTKKIRAWALARKK